MPAIPLITAAAGVYSTVKGVQNQNKAANAAQTQANLAQTAGQNSQADAQLQAYYDSNPAFAAEYNRNRIASGDTRSPLQWLSDGLRSDAAGMADFQKFAATAPAGIPGSAIGPGGTVDVNILQRQAQNVAQQNAAGSAALEAQYNPGAQELRAGSLQALLGSLGESPEQTQLKALLSGAVGNTRTGVAPITAQQMQASLAPAAQQANSGLLNDAVARAQADLALGGALPQDVRNLVARNALARSGSVTGGLGLGRDITARDLGLTSLQLQQQRLQNAQGLGQAQLAGNQYNASAANAVAALNAQLGSSANQYNAGAQNSAAQFNAGQQQQANQYDATNFLNQASLLNSISSGDFARAMAAAQLGQSIQAPASGLSPGSVADVAIGNVNLANNAQQQANAVKAQTGAQQTALGGQLIGAALPSTLDWIKNLAAPKATNYGYTGTEGAPSYYGGSAVGNFGFSK